MSRRLLRDLESRTFASFGEMLSYLRINVSHSDHEAFSRMLGYSTHHATWLKRIEEQGKLPTYRLAESVSNAFELPSSYTRNICYLDRWRHRLMMFVNNMRKNGVPVEPVPSRQSYSSPQN